MEMLTRMNLERKLKKQIVEVYENMIKAEIDTT